MVVSCPFAEQARPEYRRYIAEADYMVVSKISIWP